MPPDGVPKFFRTAFRNEKRAVCYAFAVEFEKPAGRSWQVRVTANRKPEPKSRLGQSQIGIGLFDPDEGAGQGFGGDIGNGPLESFVFQGLKEPSQLIGILVGPKHQGGRFSHGTGEKGQQS
jgi:hypothetical protein